MKGMEKMIDTGYLYSKDNRRIFVNTCLGCTGKCSYCYLGKMGYDNSSIVGKVKKAEELIEKIEQAGISRDTLITLGCFSECWDDNNKTETIKLIKYFLQKGNQIQLSTKKKICIEEVKEFHNLIQYVGQLVIFISSATISKWETIESGTDSPSNRFKTFEISRVLNIPTVLYMKPVLKGITIKDIELYVKVIQKYNVENVVVGSIFSDKESEETVHFSDKEKLFYNPISDECEIKERLKEIEDLKVYSRSSEVIQYYKKSL